MADFFLINYIVGHQPTPNRINVERRPPTTKNATSTPSWVMRLAVGSLATSTPSWVMRLAVGSLATSTPSWVMRASFAIIQTLA